LQFFDVDSGLAPVSFQERVNLGLLHKVFGQRHVQRRQTDGDVVENFDGNSTHAKNHHRAKDRIAFAADNDLEFFEIIFPR